MSSRRRFIRLTLQTKEAKCVIQTAYLELELHLSSSQRDNVPTGIQHFLIFMITWKCQRQRTSWILMLERYKRVYSALNLEDEVTWTLDICNSSCPYPTSAFLTKAKHLKAKRKQSLIVLLFFIYYIFWGRCCLPDQCFPSLFVSLQTVKCKKYTFNFNLVHLRIHMQACARTHTTETMFPQNNVYPNHSWAIWYFSILFHFLKSSCFVF